MIDKLSRFSIYIAFGSILIGLGLMVYLGFYNRYWSDDWCYERDLEHLGVKQTLAGYFFTGEDAIRGYSTNRYGLTFITSILYLAGLTGVQLLPAIIILSLTGIIYLNTNWIAGRINFSHLSLLLACLFFVYYLLYFSPHRFQILYWRAGIHYTATIISTLLLFAVIRFRVMSNANKTAINILAATLAFIGGGLSEIGCVFMVTLFAIVMLIAFYVRKQGYEWGEKILPVIRIILASLLISMLFLILSPSNDRYRVHTDNPIPIFLMPVKALQFSIAFVIDSLKSLPLPHLMLFLFFFALAYITLADQEHRVLTARKTLWICLYLVLLVFILITAIQFPTTYFYGSPPDARGQSLSRFSMFAGLAMIGLVVGGWISLNKNPWLRIFSVSLILVVSLYTLRLIRINYDELPGFIQRAQVWDARDQMIRQAVLAGQSRIEVPVIDTGQIETRDIIRSIDMDEWTSNCATAYYGAEAFLAISP